MFLALALVSVVLIVIPYDVVVTGVAASPTFTSSISHSTSRLKFKSKDNNKISLSLSITTIYEDVLAKLYELRDIVEAKRSSLRLGGPSSNSNHIIKSESDEDFLKAIQRDNKLAREILDKLVSSESTSTSQWKFVNKKDGVTVEKCFPLAGPYISESDAERGSKHACVKSVGIIDAPPEKVFKLFSDNSRVTEYNEHCVSLKDILYINKPPIVSTPNQCWTKISWAYGPKYGPFKPRDFVSVVEYIKENGNYIILNRPAYLKACAPTGKYVRATILLAGNIIKPYGKDGKQTHFTQIAHINPGL